LFFIKNLGENGAPGMRLSLNKVIYFQYFSEVPFYKSGPKSGPSLQK